MMEAGSHHLVSYDARRIYSAPMRSLLEINPGARFLMGRDFDKPISRHIVYIDARQPRLLEAEELRSKLIINTP